MKPTLDAIREIVKEHLGLGELPDPTFTMISLGGDDLDLIEIIMQVEEDFGIEINDGNVSDDYTCNEMFAVAEKQVEASP